MTRAWQPADLRAHHRALVLQLLDGSGPMARSEIGHRSGLSVPTVTAILAELMEQGRISDAGVDPASRRGPRPTMVTLARTSTQAIGVYLGVGRATAGRCDLAGGIRQVRRVRLDPTDPPARVLRTVARTVAPLVSAAGPQLVGVGVAVPGPVDPTNRSVRLSLCLGWHDVAVADQLEQALGAPAVVEYNVQAMARAERRYGSGLSTGNLLYLHVSTGVGFAFLVDGEPLTYGPHGVSELGHHRVAPSGPPCACGVPGCLESVVNEPALVARIAEAAESRPALAQACRQQAHPLAALLADYVDHLTAGLAAAINMLSPTRVVLGGFLANAPAAVHQQIRHILAPKVCQPLRDPLHVEPAAVRRYPGVLGAASVAFEQLLFAARPVPSRRPPRSAPLDDPGAG